MATIDTPNFPVICWQVEIPVDYEISVKINSTTKRVIINQSNFTGLRKVNFEINPLNGNYLLYGYDLPGNITFQDSIAILVKHAIEAVIREPLTVQAGFLPDGGFNLNSGFQGITTYEYTKPSNALGQRLKLVVNTTGFSIGTLEIRFGDLSESSFGVKGLIPNGLTITISGGGTEGSVTSFINPAGTWFPDNRTLYENRNITSSAYTSVSTFNSNTYRTINWSNEKEQLSLEIPLVYASQIFLYRREDERFKIGDTRIDDSNNLYEQLISAARAGRKFRIFWNYDDSDDSFDSEEFFISDPDTLASLTNSLEDVTDNRGKLFSITIPFTKYEE